MFNTWQELIKTRSQSARDKKNEGKLFLFVVREQIDGATEQGVEYNPHDENCKKKKKAINKASVL